jgi:hypothetical protein
MAPKKQTKKAKLIADQAAALAEYAAKALVAAEQLRIKTKAVERFPLDDDERATVAEFPSLASKSGKSWRRRTALSPSPRLPAWSWRWRTPSWTPSRSSKWACCLPPGS